jgi:hypothetical protein
MQWLTDARRRLAAYAAHPDPLAASGNLVALVLAGNTPFYPLYVWALAGSAGWPWLLTTQVAGVVFAAVPALMRRSALAGRVTLALAATGNSLFCTWLFGEASGVQLFLLPCAMLASVLFRSHERNWMWPLAVLPVAAWYLLHGRFDAPPLEYDAAALDSLQAMNAISAGSISIFIGLVVSRLYQPAARG